ncbi:hypothetical protein LCGC14_2564320 [marine sediment metagenome]|uniref:N-acetyltransferase domain-containing protein n=1 Tax=marine sediment metagenome TaxID=412755 RepID=A0A0F9CVA8_9ZZZZ
MTILIKYEIVSTTEEHQEELINTMRQADIDECWAANHHTPETAIEESVYYTNRPRTGLVNNQVLNIFGVGKITHLSDIGIPWMLGSDLLPQHAKAFLRSSKNAIEDMKKEAILLHNYVDKRNRDAIKWLRWLGFIMEKPIIYGPDDMLFHPFYMVNYDV